ncbi:MAG: hypothetical protein JW870_09710, partial [Candidatus Delongbacteria bacterium]|nr:hypothetical protein [Candidatus Delongbacteria bacterium]
VLSISYLKMNQFCNTNIRIFGLYCSDFDEFLIYLEDAKINIYVPWVSILNCWAQLKQTAK